MIVRLTLKHRAGVEASRIQRARLLAAAPIDGSIIPVCRLRRRFSGNLAAVVVIIELRLQDGGRRCIERALFALSVPLDGETPAHPLPAPMRTAALSVAADLAKARIADVEPIYRQTLARAGRRERCIAKLFNGGTTPVQAGLLDSRPVRARAERMRMLTAASDESAARLRLLERSTDSLSAQRLDVRLVLDARRP